MSDKPADEGWTKTSCIYAAEGRFVIDHDGGRLDIQLTYFSNTPAFVVLVQHETPEREMTTGHHLLRLESLPSLLEHVATILRQGREVCDASKPKPQATTCRLRALEGGR